MTQADGVVVIIGHPGDEHVAAVVTEVGARARVVLVDAASLSTSNWLWNEGLLIDGPDGAARPRRGWLRRLAPSDWHYGLRVGSLEYVEAQAALQALVAVADPISGVTWLTDYWSMVRGENKLVQYRVASDLGIPVPRTIVATRASKLSCLGESFVVKPLAGGGFDMDDEKYAIHAQAIAAHDDRLDGLAVAPMLAQRQIHAARHLRIPTVGSEAWPCEISGVDRPVDWRADPNAHRAWRRSEDSNSIQCAAAGAVALARSLRLGYSCQDWIVDENDTAWLVDVNPSGQWLFLPPDVARTVSRAIAHWLVTA